MAEFVDECEHSFEFLHGAVIEMCGVEPEAFDVVLGILDDILADFLEYFGFRQIETP